MPLKGWRSLDLIPPMSSNLIILTGLIYAYIAIEQGLKGNLPMAICYICYAGANVGLYMMATK